MEKSELTRCLPTMSIVTEELERRGWHCHRGGETGARFFRSARLYRGERKLSEDVVYVLTAESVRVFPVDGYSFVSTASTAGRADHLLCPGQKPEDVLLVLLELFDRYREYEARMDRMVLSGASLDALCALGEELTGFPVCVHDEWFIITAMSRRLPEVMPPETVAESNRGFIPRAMIESFKNNPDYERSLSRRQAGLWYANPDRTGKRSIFVNLRDGDMYRGRLLILEDGRALCQSDFLLANCLGQRANLIMQRQKTAESRSYRSMDDIAYGLLTGSSLQPAETTLFLDTLNWRRTDRFLCICLQTQRTDETPVMDRVLHSELFQLFPNAYIMFMENRQCIILNLSRESVPVTQVRHRLAAVCRDYYLYAGISSPVWGVDELRYAFQQTGIALEQAFFLRNERWVIPFSTIVLDYALRKLPGELPPGYLVAPELLELLDYDRKKGSEYFGTLRTYLLCERDIPRTADALIIHRTTLLYRLKKIQSLLGMNLDDSDTRLYLLLSLKLLEQMDYSDTPAAGGER